MHAAKQRATVRNRLRNVETYAKVCAPLSTARDCSNARTHVNYVLVYNVYVSDIIRARQLEYRPKIIWLDYLDGGWGRGNTPLPKYLNIFWSIKYLFYMNYQNLRTEKNIFHVDFFSIK